MSGMQEWQMLYIFLAAFVLAASTIWVHAAGISLLMRYSPRALSQPQIPPFAIRRSLLRVVWGLFLLHIAEIALWALFYLWRGYLPNAEAAFYFSGVTYTTVGYGDIVLAKPYRLLAPVEGLVGVLMCSLSTGYFFVVANRILQRQPQGTPIASDKE